MTAKTILLLVLGSQTLYLLLHLLRLRLGKYKVDEAVDAFGHIIASWTVLLWAPIVLVRLLVLDPLRISIEWGASHHDTRSDPKRYWKGRYLRPVIPGLVSVGTYTFTCWVPDEDTSGTQTNQIIEIGREKFGIALIRLGTPTSKRTEVEPPKEDVA